MNDAELLDKQGLLQSMNERNAELVRVAADLEAEFEHLRMEMQRVQLKRAECVAERAKLKADYGRLYEEVGVELKRRAAEDVEQAED